MTQLAARPISHILPVDGTEHVPVECYCHPEIHETNGVAATMGLDDLLPAESEGALSFVHRSALTPCDEWQVSLETDG